MVAVRDQTPHCATLHDELTAARDGEDAFVGSKKEPIAGWFSRMPCTCESGNIACSSSDSGAAAQPARILAAITAIAVKVKARVRNGMRDSAC